jgi:hypothetical protein
MQREITMSREICFCGWVGELEDREPVYTDVGELGLSCPMCGRVDRLEAWSEVARAATLAEAARRRGGIISERRSHVWSRRSVYQ